MAIPVIATTIYVGYHRKYYRIKTTHWNYAYYPLFKPVQKLRALLKFKAYGIHSLFIAAATSSTEIVQNSHLNQQHVARQKRETQSARIVVISDSHELHRSLSIPDGDVLIHCGDILFADSNKFSLRQSLDKIRDFNEWLGSLPHRHKLIVAGNHDYCFERIGKDQCREMLSNGRYLENDAVTLSFGGRERSIKLFCSPCSIPNSKFSTNRAFQLNRDEIGPRIWSQIPEDVDILVTHHMPRGFMCNGKGCEYLRDLVRNKCVRCKYHLFGHWHGTFGVAFGGTEFKNEFRESVCFVNASTVDDYICAIHPPLVFDYPLN